MWLLGAGDIDSMPVSTFLPQDLFTVSHDSGVVSIPNKGQLFFGLGLCPAQVMMGAALFQGTFLPFAFYIRIKPLKKALHLVSEAFGRSWSLQ